MSDNRSTRLLIGIVFLVAAGLLAISNLVQRVALGEWWLAGALALIGVGFILWPEAKKAADTPAARPKTTLPKEPDSLKEQRAEIMKKPEAAITTPPPKEIIVTEDEKPAKPAPAPEPTPAPAQAAGEPDDLTRVEGIGPKYRDALVAAGVDTFAKVAEQSLDDLQAIAKAAGMRKTTSMETWAQQAKLAAKGDWAALEKLQDELTGGRKS